MGTAGSGSRILVLAYGAGCLLPKSQSRLGFLDGLTLLTILMTLFQGLASRESARAYAVYSLVSTGLIFLTGGAANTLRSSAA